MTGFYKWPNFFEIDKLKTELSENNLFDFSRYLDFRTDQKSHLSQLLSLHEDTYQRSFGENSADGVFEKYRQFSFSDIKSLPSKDQHYSRRKAFEFEMSNISTKTELITPELDKLIKKFPSDLGRIRLAVLLGNSEILPHIDHGDTDLIRIHIPLITNNECYFYLKVKGQETKTLLPADGSIYTFNVGKRHWVKNNSAQPRVHLMIDVYDTEFKANFSEMK